MTEISSGKIEFAENIRQLNRHFHSNSAGFTPGLNLPKPKPVG